MSEKLNAFCRTHLSAFTQKAFQVLEPATAFEYNWHIGCIAEHLEAVWNNEIQNLIINMPPRALKTLTTSVCFPAWALGHAPSEQFMLTSYKASLAEKMTRKTRKLVKSDWYKQCFPETVISDELDRQYYFETTKQGQYFSSAMSSVTGEGCNIQICDDPINPDEALSDTIRNGTNDTIRGTLFSRFNDPRTGRFILNMQRLHEDDPTGNLLQDQGWHHLKLPAEAKERTHHIILKNKEWKLEQGELLFPKRFTEDVLHQARDRLGEYNYAGQYLQEPIPLGGGVFKDDRIQFYQPGSVNARDMNLYILVDPAGGDEDEKKKKKKSSDWTALMVIGLASDNNYYLLDIIRDRLNPTERVDTLFLLHRKWNALTGKPPKVGYEKISLGSDTHYIKLKQDQDNYRFPLITLGGTMAKTTRIMRLVPDIEIGRWYFPTSCMYVDCEDRSFDLVHELINCEMASFPRARFDDMLDALSRIYEADLQTVFPKLKTKQIAPRNEPESWEDF